MTNREEFKEEFYNNLRKVLWRVPCTDKLIIAADFNATVGKVDKWPCVIGPCGVSKCNSNSELLLGLSSEHNLVITNTIFKRKEHHQTTWMQLRSKHWHTLDYVIVRQVDQNDILNTRPMRGAEYLTNHILLRSTVAFSISKNIPKLLPKHPPRLMWWNYEIKITKRSWRSKSIKLWQDFNIRSQKLLKKTGIV